MDVTNSFSKNKKDTYFLAVGDLHYSLSNEKNSNIMERDILNIITSNNLKFIVILGDILDTHERINLKCFMRACNFFNNIIKTGVDLFILIGNHDRPNNRVFLTDEHPFNLYKNVPGITIVDTCYVHEIDSLQYDSKPGDKMRFCFVPYVPDGRYLEALQVCNIDPTIMTMFFSHSEFDGCKINKLTQKPCDKWPLEYPMNISGHIHNEELVQPNLFYTGTPIQHDFSDTSDKGVYLMNLTDGKFKFTKQALTVPNKVIITVHWTQLENVQLNPNCENRLKIIGPIDQVKNLLKRPDLISKFAHVSKRFKEETREIKDMPLIMNNFQFHETMLNGMDEKLLPVFRHLFPDIL